MLHPVPLYNAIDLSLVLLIAPHRGELVAPEGGSKETNSTYFNQLKAPHRGELGISFTSIK
jgi:hypothetical protein